MRRSLWTGLALMMGLAIGCGPTGQTEVQPPADLKTDAGDPAKPAPRAKTPNKSDMPSMKPVD